MTTFLPSMTTLRDPLNREKLMTARLRDLFCLALIGLAWSSTTVHAQFLAERLVPPQQVAIPLLPTTQQPASAATSGIEKTRQHLWSLPFAPLPGAPVSLSVESLPVDWHRPVVDAPMLVAEAEPTRPAVPRLPDAMRSYVSSVNPLQTPVLNRFPQPKQPPVRPVDDPSAEQAYSLLTVPVPLSIPSPAPLLRLSIPDPFEQLRIVRLANPPADLDDPAASQERPSLPKLPSVQPPQ